MKITKGMANKAFSAFDQAEKEINQVSKANTVNMSVGNISRNAGAPPKTSGIKIRGTGAATKGTIARGPMA